MQPIKILLRNQLLSHENMVICKDIKSSLHTFFYSETGGKHCESTISRSFLSHL